MDLGTLSVKFAADTSGLSGGLGSAASMLSGFAQTAGSAFGPVGEALAGIATVAIGVGAASIKLAGDFQESMDKVQAYAGMTKAQTTAMGQSILALAPALGQTPKALADGLYYVASAGFKGAEGLNILKYAGMTAAASNVSASVTSAALVAALNGLGLKGKDAGNTMDILNATVSDGVLSWDDYGRVVGKLASSFVGTGESAKQMHTNFIDANAGLDLFTNAGVSARLASTNLSSTINILENKTDSIAAHAKSMGISFDEQKFKTMDLQHQMAYLGQITDNNSGEMIKLMGGNSGAAKTIDFLNANSKKYGATIDDITGKMRNGQTTQDKFNVAQEGFNFQMARAGAAIQVVGIKIGTLLLPVMGQIMGFVTPLISGFGNLISGSSGLSSATGGLSNVFRSLGTFVAPLVANFKTLWATVSTNLLPVIEQFANSLKGPLQQAFSSISATVGGVFTGHMKTAEGIVSSLSKWFKSDLMPAVKSAEPGFQAMASVMVGTVIPGMVKLWAIGQKVVDEVMPPLVKVFEAAIPPIIKIAGVIEGGLAASLKFLMPYILQGAAALGQFAGEVATRVAPILINFFHNLNTAIDVFMVVWKTVWPYLAPILKGVWDEIMGVIKVAWAIVSGIVKIGLDLLSGNWSQAWTDCKDMLSGIWDGIKSIIGGGVQIVLGIVTGAMGAVSGIFSSAWDGIKGLFQQGINGAISAFRPLLEAMSHIPGPIGDMANSVLNSMNSMQHGSVSSAAKMGSGVTAQMLLMKSSSLMQVAQTHAQAAEHFDQMRRELIQQIANTSDPVKKKALEMKLGVVTSAEETEKQASDKAKTMAVKVAEQAKMMSSETQARAHEMKTGTGNWFTNMAGFVGGVVSGMWKNVTGLFSNAWGNLKNALGTLWTNFSNWFSDLAHQAIQWGEDIINGIISGIKNVAGNIGGAISGAIGDVKSGLHNAGIPGFAGGVSNFSGGWAVVGENGPELVQLPRGTDVIPQPQWSSYEPKASSYPASTSAYPSTRSYSASSAPAQAPVIHNHFHVSIDGQQLSTVITPHVMNEVVYQARSHKSGGKAA